jgi:hypothetical protein
VIKDLKKMRTAVFLAGLIIICFIAYKVMNSRRAQHYAAFILAWNSATKEFINGCIDNKHDGSYRTFKNLHPSRWAMLDYLLVYVRMLVLMAAAVAYSIRFMG